MKLPLNLQKIWGSRNQRTILTALTAGALLVVIISVINFVSIKNQTNSVTQSSGVGQLIIDAQGRLDNDRGNANRYATLCQLYLQKVRESADTSFYSKCDELLATATGIDPVNAEVLASQAAVAYGRHTFKSGLELSKKALALNSDKVFYYGLVGDGQLELGEYQQSSDTFQTMVNKRPDLAAYNRVAYIRELYGDIDGAKAALKSAIAAGSSFPENIAFSQVELGKLEARNDLDAAKRTFKEALRTYEDYTPALEGLGKVSFRQNDHSQATKYFQKAFDTLPLSQYAAALGDVYAADVDKDKSDQQYFLAQLAFDQSSSGGVNNDYELSIFLTQRGRDTKNALALANSNITDRPNVFSYDALAWAQYRDSNFKDAQLNIDKAMNLRENQPVVLYHAGLIASKLGQKDKAKTYLETALKQDKYFLEAHFSLLDYNEAMKILEKIR